ncbi:GLUTAMATE-RICH WD REPEAT-CONTAINING PROTEIN 1 [Salix koriyanagi]|uniref:GLUTAMATE-RICH WD REPEAT-CONTAINING PROTEIN 1 n=1 Tax=Salix koriyanagi TaxID=2511006 RepID=A0A9Q0UP93_9ROSI|nr:GLUTAMATE-RICH WD REPEAT-CONTAINING PROTEIN 1 [Salix koriyanagi]
MVRSIKNPKKAKRKNKKGDGSSSSSSVLSMPTKVWQPGVDNLEEGEELECDPHRLQLSSRLSRWPCLSFDVVRDSLGLLRTDFPHTVYFVAGTQAENPDWNSIGIFKVSNVSGKRRELVPTKATTSDSDMDTDNSNSDSDEDSEDEEEGGSAAPILQLRKVAHSGCVNRIRAMTQNPHICASWSDAGCADMGLQHSSECLGRVRNRSSLGRFFSF